MATRKHIHKVILYGEDITHKVKGIEIRPIPLGVQMVADRSMVSWEENIKITFLDGSSGWYSCFECEVVVLFEE